ncbi:MAG TPA: radical SAM protein [Candidatus Binataceae bacterium]|nr:radical SAM protein [Candidatus Binataceae bacterium]
MKFEIDALTIEEASRGSALAERLVAALASSVPVSYVANGREASRPIPGSDPFGAGKRQIVVMTRRTPFLMACPAGSARFACCGYLVLVLASNCPMDCSYCFLQEHVANNPAFQIYSNYADSFQELDRLAQSAPGRHFRVGTGELADSLALDRITGLSLDLIEFARDREHLTLELKTKTAEIDNLLKIDPRGRVLVSWTLSPNAVWKTSEHRTASPSERIAAARKLLDAGYRVGFHFDPIIAFDSAEHDYAELIDELLAAIPAGRIAFVSMGALRMTPALRSAARRRFPNDPMLLGEEVLGPDGRLRAFAALRIRLYRALQERFARAGAEIPSYLCMETGAVHEKVFGTAPANPATIGARLALG